LREPVSEVEDMNPAGKRMANDELSRARQAVQDLIAKGYILPGVYGSLSVKAERASPYGGGERALWVFGPQKACLEKPMELILEGIQRVLKLEDLPASELKNELHRARARASDPIPEWECLLHATFDRSSVAHTCPPALMAIASSLDGLSRLEKIFSDCMCVLEELPPGNSPARRLSEIVTKACYLAGYGLWSSGQDVEACVALIEEIESRAQDYLHQRKAWEIREFRAPDPESALRKRVAVARKDVSGRLGYPVILSQDQGLYEAGLFQRLKEEPGFKLEPPTLYHACYTGVAMAQTGEDRVDVIPERVHLDPDLGACPTGASAEQAFQTGSCLRSSVQAWQRAERLGGYRAPSFEALGGEQQLAFLEADKTPKGMFAGEVALVTGGASGIGKACVESLLRRGAAVASMDINPGITEMHACPEYLGLHCDLTDEEAVLGAFEALARRFGGLDMLVLNAGIFPAGIRIEALDLAHWQKVMRINLDSNLVVLREAYPLLAASPKGGRVLVNASKNVLAPGAGAAAYSSAKAAVTQLARVAALEWGKDKIRVNMIHPDAVFDTGIWTEEVLQARAAHYGMSVQQYKTRNLLGTELNSHYIGELAAEMLSPLFEKITGAQFAVDGGTDRTI
jgi:NAD(P)-dependent dehydrogenase (short-subunit alcohol dehydrogenase family)/rhamnose utilization protein RhaD (predicted bifunctional aldolase and dehydrogenase)